MVDGIHLPPDTDLLPLRKRKRGERGGEGGSLSPPRKSRSRDLDLSPPRRGRDDDDMSPPRRGKNKDDGDISPPRRRRGSDDDISPPRRRRGSDDDISPPRRRRGSDDISPPRRRRGSDDDISPPRRRRGSDDDISPPRRRRGSDDDISPPRRRRGSDDDISSPRRRLQEKTSTSPPSSAKRRERKSSRRGDEKGAGGEDIVKMTGLIQGDQVADISRRKREEKKRKYEQTNPEESGQNAETVYRDRRGRKLDTLSAFMMQEEVRQGKRKKEEKQKMEWGKGLVQTQSQAEMAARLAEEASAPFARTKDDERMNADLRKETRWGDPMAGLVQEGEGYDVQNAITKTLIDEKKRRKEMKRAMKKLKKESGKDEVDESLLAEMVNKELEKKEKKEKKERKDKGGGKRESKKGEKREKEKEKKLEKKDLRMMRKMDHEKKQELMKKGVNPLNPRARVYNGGCPENRFNIRPGYRWDGVDRSNGFEKEFFLRGAEKKANELAAYRWSCSDM